jgi:predicted Fe-Mo cluster-binding NifX family protein
MKIAISSEGPTLDAAVDPRFGRCEFFVIVELENMDFEAVPNKNQALEGGAGIQAAKVVVDKGADGVLTGYIGPNAERVLSSAGLNVITAVSGTVGEIAQQYKDGRMEATRRNDVAGGIDAPIDHKVGSMERSFQAVLPGVGMGRGRGYSGGRNSLHRVHGFDMGRDCVCPNCGERISHELDKACFQKKCPRCGTFMTLEQVL